VSDVSERRSVGDGFPRINSPWGRCVLLNCFLSFRFAVGINSGYSPWMATRSSKTAKTGKSRLKIFCGAHPDTPSSQGHPKAVRATHLSVLRRGYLLINDQPTSNARTGFHRVSRGKVHEQGITTTDGARECIEDCHVYQSNTGSHAPRAATRIPSSCRFRRYRACDFGNSPEQVGGKPHASRANV